MRELRNEFDKDLKDGLFFIPKLNKWVIPQHIIDSYVVIKDVITNRLEYCSLEYKDFIPFNSSDLGYFGNGISFSYYQRMPRRQYNKSITEKNTYADGNSFKFKDILYHLTNGYEKINSHIWSQLCQGFYRKFPLSKHFAILFNWSKPTQYLVYCDEIVAGISFDNQDNKLIIENYLVKDEVVYLIDYLLKKECKDAFKD